MSRVALPRRIEKRQGSFCLHFDRTQKQSGAVGGFATVALHAQNLGANAVATRHTFAGDLSAGFLSRQTTLERRAAFQRAVRSASVGTSEPVRAGL